MRSVYCAVEKGWIDYVGADENATRHRNARREGITIDVDVVLLVYEIVGRDATNRVESCEWYR